MAVVFFFAVTVTVPDLLIFAFPSTAFAGFFTFSHFAYTVGAFVDAKEFVNNII